MDECPGLRYARLRATRPSPRPHGRDDPVLGGGERVASLSWRGDRSLFVPLDDSQGWPGTHESLHASSPSGRPPRPRRPRPDRRPRAGGRDPRPGREGDPPGGRLPQVAAEGRRVLARSDRPDRAGRAGPDHGRRVARVAPHRPGLSGPDPDGRRRALRDLHPRPQDHGPLGEPRALSAGDRGLCGPARRLADPVGAPPDLGLLGLSGGQRPGGIERQLELAVCPARPECRERGRRPGPRGGLAPGPSLLGRRPVPRRRLGLPLGPARRGVRHHDLRGDLQPGHHRPQAEPIARAAGRRPDRALRRGRERPRPASRARLAGGQLRRRIGPDLEVSTISMDWSGPGG